MNVTVVLQHLSAAQRRNAQKEKNEGNSDPFFIPALFSSERHFPYGHKKNSQSAFPNKVGFPGYSQAGVFRLAGTGQATVLRILQSAVTAFHSETLRSRLPPNPKADMVIYFSPFLANKHPLKVLLPL